MEKAQYSKINIRFCDVNGLKNTFLIRFNIIGMQF